MEIGKDLLETLLDMLPHVVGLGIFCNNSAYGNQSQGPSRSGQSRASVQGSSRSILSLGRLPLSRVLTNQYKSM